MLSGGLESQTLLRTPMVLSTGVDGRFNKGIYNLVNSRNFPFDHCHWAFLETDFIRMKSLFLFHSYEIVIREHFHVT